MCRTIDGDGDKITPQRQVTGIACLFGLFDRAFLLRFSVQTGKFIRANSVESIGEGYYCLIDVEVESNEELKLLLII